jgi:hypothetical protein
MKTGLGWYKEHGRFYDVAQCQNCGSTVTMTQNQEKKNIKESKGHSALSYLDDNMTCCEDAYYFYPKMGDY